jgi:hypothetical protein
VDLLVDVLISRLLQNFADDGLKLLLGDRFNPILKAVDQLMMGYTLGVLIRQDKDAGRKSFR